MREVGGGIIESNVNWSRRCDGGREWRVDFCHAQGMNIREYSEVLERQIDAEKPSQLLKHRVNSATICPQNVRDVLFS